MYSFRPYWKDAKLSPKFTKQRRYTKVPHNTRNNATTSIPTVEDEIIDFFFKNAVTFVYLLDTRKSAANANTRHYDFHQH